MNATDICNAALGLIGQNFITGLDDGTHTANQCNIFFLPARDACLRDHLWNFAQKRAALAQTTAPGSQWSYAYQLPADCLRVIALNAAAQREWAVEGRTLVTNEPTVIILYIAKVDDVNLWDALFVDAFTILLASKLALAVAHDAGYSADLFKLYNLRLADAKAVDGQEQGATDPLGAPDLIEVRD